MLPFAPSICSPYPMQFMPGQRTEQFDIRSNIPRAIHIGDGLGTLRFLVIKRSVVVWKTIENHSTDLEPCWTVDTRSTT